MEDGLASFPSREKPPEASENPGFPANSQ